MDKIGRNDRCWCGSGKKYKHCHMGSVIELKREELENKYGEFGTRSMLRDLAIFNEEIVTGKSIGKTNLKEILDKIKKGKETNTRSLPSKNTIFGVSKISKDLRIKLLDIVGTIVDQNWCGRSEMCVLFAILLADGLKKLGEKPKIIIGESEYHEQNNPSNSFCWNHSWIELNNEIIDGNVDSMIENPVVPEGINPKCYWGLKDGIPEDRKIISGKEVDEEWIKNNTTSKDLQDWRNQLYQKLKELKIV